MIAQKNMQLKKINIKTAIVGTVALSLLSVMVPETAQAAKCPNDPLNPTPTNPRANINFKNFFGQPSLTFDFNVKPGTRIGSAGQFKLGGCYKQPQQSNMQYKLVDLTVTPFTLIQLPDDIASGFFDLEINPDGDYFFYKYDFFDASANLIEFYVPSKFIYQDSISIDLTGDSTDVFIRRLEGLGKILAQLKSSRINSIVFPYNVTPIQPYNITSIQPVGVPEPNSSTSLIFGGLIGGLHYLKAKKLEIGKR